MEKRLWFEVNQPLREPVAARTPCYATSSANFMPRALIILSTVPRLGFPSLDWTIWIIEQCEL